MVWRWSTDDLDCESFLHVTEKKKLKKEKKKKKKMVNRFWRPIDSLAQYYPLALAIGFQS